MERAGRRNSGGKESRKSLSPGKDDSLLDFKSPKQESVVRVKVVGDKRGKKSSSKGKTSANKKKQVAVKEVAQPSIESSFFKAAINSKRDGHTCPLCMKYFADTSAGTVHTKSCAARNRVSTKKLLAAVALQERQVNERVAIGLPAGPIAQPKDNTPRRPRESVAKGDPDLQLALALSKSLQEKQLEQELEEALLLAREHRGDGQIVGFSSESERKSTLKNFGFLTSKPIGAFEGPGKTRRKKRLGPTILETRSQEARDRLLTERIAEVLMGDERITQVSREESAAEVQSIQKQPVVLRSRLLREIYRATERLWDTAQLPSTGANFYVEDLSPIIMPAVVQKRETSENPGEGSNNAEITDRIKEEASPATFEESPLNEDDRLTEKLSESSEELEQINKVANNRSGTPRLNDIHVTDRQYRNTLSMDWASTLNVSSISDVVVLLENGHVWAHKLVFHVRCSDILLDCEPNSDTKFSHVREKICWPDVDRSTGLAFLEFVYSGLIEKNAGVLSDERLASGVRRLARRYRLKALFDYLRKKRAELDRLNRAAEESEARRSGLRSPIVIEIDPTPSETETAQANLPTSAESQDTDEDRQSTRSSPSRGRNDSSSVQVIISTDPTAESDSQSHVDAKSAISVASSHSCGSMSPDLFDETTEEATVDTAKTGADCEQLPDESNNDNSNLKVLADLIAGGDLSSSGRSTASTILYDPLSAKSPSRDEADDLSSLSQCPTETPRSRCSSTLDEAEIPRPQRFPGKQKSNMSLFIEKMERINAKGPFDSYTDDESLAQPPPLNRRRNPFNVDRTTDTFSLDSSEKLKTKRVPGRNKNRGLSVFDQLEATSPTNENIDESKLAEDSTDADEKSCTVDDTANTVDDTANTDDEDVSMYSKYRKTHKHHNSISNYRKMLEKLVNPSTASEDDESSDKLSTLNDDAMIDLTQETNSEVDVPPSPVSAAPEFSDRENVANASDDESMRAESTAIAHSDNSNASDDGEKRKHAGIGQAASAASSSGGKSDEGKAKHSDSVDKFNKNQKNAPQCIINTTPESVKILRNSSLSSLHNLLDEDLEIFAHSWKSKTRSPSPIDLPPSGQFPHFERKRKSEERARSRFNDDSQQGKEAKGCSAANRPSRGKKSSGNSSRRSHCDLLDEDDEIFAHSWQTKTRSPLPRSSSDESLPKERQRRSKERTKKNGCDDDLREGEKAARRSETSKAENSLRSPSDYPELDVFEINEEMFAQGSKKLDVPQRRSFTHSPKDSFDYSARSTSSHRKRRAKESRTKYTSFDDSLLRKSLGNTSKYPDIDVDELLTQSLRSKAEMPRRSPTPVENDSSGSPEKLSSSSRKIRSSRKTIRKSFTDRLDNNKQNKSLEDAESSPEYRYEVFEPDNHVFTQSFGSPRLSPYKALSPSPNSAPPSKIGDQVSTLKVPSPILISSSPEIDLGTETNASNYERDCDKENRSATCRRSPLAFSRNLENIAEAITPTNHERSALFWRDRLEDPVEEFSPRNLERATTPQPGTSRNYSNSNRNLSSSAKSPLVRWNSMPASSSNGEVQRKRSRTPKTSSRLVISQDVTPPVNYDAMDTPKLKEELAKYGIKPQRRSRARQLLNYIYNELHPVVPVASLENFSDDLMPLGDDYEPPAKKIGKPSNRTSDDSDSDREIPLSQQSNTNGASVIPEEMDFADGNVSSDDSNDSGSTNNIKKAFAALIKDDREMHNKILTYEPLPLELVHLMLKARGLKCKYKDLMDFLDEECITFQVQSQRTRSNKTRVKKTARSGKGKASSQKS